MGRRDFAPLYFGLACLYFPAFCVRGESMSKRFRKSIRVREWGKCSIRRENWWFRFQSGVRNGFRTSAQTHTFIGSISNNFLRKHVVKTVCSNFSWYINAFAFFMDSFQTSRNFASAEIIQESNLTKKNVTLIWLKIYGHYLKFSMLLCQKVFTNNCVSAWQACAKIKSCSSLLPKDQETAMNF